MENSRQQTNHQTIIINNNKSRGLAFILTLLFGPLGMFYSTVLGAIIMLIINIIVGFLTAGLGCIFLWPICIIWGILAVKNESTVIVTGEKE